MVAYVNSSLDTCFHTGAFEGDVYAVLLSYSFTDCYGGFFRGCEFVFGCFWASGGGSNRVSSLRLSKGPLRLKKDGSNPCVAKPSSTAKSTRPSLISVIITREAPDSFAIALTRRPTAPAPMTRTVEPGKREPLRTARRVEWIATESGSMREAVP